MDEALSEALKGLILAQMFFMGKRWLDFWTDALGIARPDSAAQGLLRSFLVDEEGEIWGLERGTLSAEFDGAGDGQAWR